MASGEFSIKRNRGGWNHKATCHPDQPHYAKDLCKSCYLKTPEVREVQKRNNARNGYKHKLKHRHGITIEQYDTMLYEQGGACAICGREDAGREGVNPLYVDHDHNTGVIRGLLCNNCNMGVGYFKDDIELLMSAIRYLQQQQAECADVD